MQFPERFAVRFAIVIAAAVFLLGAYLNAANPSSGWIEAGVVIWWHICKFTVFPLWFVMRVWVFSTRFTARHRSS